MYQFWAQRVGSLRSSDTFEIGPMADVAGARSKSMNRVQTMVQFES